MLFLLYLMENVQKCQRPTSSEKNIVARGGISTPSVLTESWTCVGLQYEAMTRSEMLVGHMGLLLLLHQHLAVNRSRLVLKPNIGLRPWLNRLTYH